MSENAPVCPHVSYDGKACNRCMHLRPDSDRYYCRMHQRNYSQEECRQFVWRRRGAGKQPGNLGPQWGWMRVPQPLYEATNRARTKLAEQEGRDKPLSYTEIVSRALAAYPPIASEVKDD